MAKRLTSFSKFLITLVIVAAIFFGGRYILQNTEFGQNLLGDLNSMENPEDKSDKKSSNKALAGDDDVLKVQIFTWGGYAPGLYFNEGAEPTEQSRFYKEYGLKVQFVLIDDFDGSRQAWKADEVDLLANETGAMTTEMEGLAQYDPRIVLQCDWSRGGDAVVVRRNIKNVNDLKGKRIAYAGFTPSVTFLVYMLESAGLTMDDIIPVEVPLPTDAANAFIGNQVDAAIVWSPDDQKCVREVVGARVLQSTKEASNIVADVYIAKEDFVRSNKEKIEKFYEGWMKGAAEINTQEANKDKAARILAKVTKIPVPDARAAIDNVRLTTHGDNMNYFGLNVSYKGMTGETLYNKMGEEFEKLDQAPADRPSWRTISYPTAAMTADTKLTGALHAAEGAADFTPVTEEAKEKPAISKKLVSINFPTGKFELTENAKTIIDLQFASVLKSYGNTRIRIEGNTDNVGSKSMNKELSLKRAQSVADYLMNAYNVAPNRLIVVGNGPDKPVVGCEGNQNEDCRARNRRTEFQLVAG